MGKLVPSAPLTARGMAPGPRSGKAAARGALLGGALAGISALLLAASLSGHLGDTADSLLNSFVFESSSRQLGGHLSRTVQVDTSA